MQEEKDNSHAEINWQLNLIVLWIGSFLACASYTMCIPFLPVFLLQDLHVAQQDVNFWSGLTFSIAFLGAGIMAPYWGARGDKVGQRRMAIRAGFGLAVTYFMTGLCQNAWHLFLVRGFCGLISGFVPASMSLVSSTIPKNKLGWGMGLMQTAIASGNIIGPLLGGYMSSWFGMRMSFFLGGGFLFISTLLVVFLVKDVPHCKTCRAKKNNLFKDIGTALRNADLRYVMCMFFVVQGCIMLIQPLITMHVGELMGKMDDETIQMAGIIFSLAGVAGILASTFWGKQGQKHGYILMFCLVTFSAGIVNLFQYVVQDVYQFALVQFIYGLFLSGAVPNINARLVESTDQAMRGKAFGLLTSAQQLGGVFGPLLGGVFGRYMSTRYVLMLAGCILLTVSVYTYCTKVKGDKAL